MQNIESVMRDLVVLSYANPQQAVAQAERMLQSTQLPQDSTLRHWLAAMIPVWTARLGSTEVRLQECGTTGGRRMMIERCFQLFNAGNYSEIKDIALPWLASCSISSTEIYDALYWSIKGAIHAQQYDLAADVAHVLLSVDTLMRKIRDSVSDNHEQAYLETVVFMTYFFLIPDVIKAFATKQRLEVWEQMLIRALERLPETLEAAPDLLREGKKMACKTLVDYYLQSGREADAAQLVNLFNCGR